MAAFCIATERFYWDDFREVGRWIKRMFPPKKARFQGLGDSWGFAGLLLGTLNNHFLMVGYQMDDSKSLHGKWLFHKTSIKKWLFGVPGIYKITFEGLK